MGLKKMDDWEIKQLFSYVLQQRMKAEKALNPQQPHLLLNKTPFSIPSPKFKLK